MQVRPRLLQVEQRAEEVRTPGEPFPAVQRLIVARDDRLGDLVVSLPAVDALRRTYPRARMALLVAPALAPLARTVRGVDEVLSSDSDPGRLRLEIETFDADLIVCISRGAAIPRAASRAGVQLRVGTGYRIYSPMFTHAVGERRRAGGRHEVEYALSFAHRSGAAAAPASFPLSLSDSAAAAATDWLRAQGVDDAFVVLHPGSGGSCPRWPAGCFVRLARELVDTGMRVVLSIGPEDGWCAALLAESPPEFRMLPRFTGGLETLPALLRRAALLVSSSTGPLHLAAALGTATLGIYAPWPTCGVTRWGPYAKNGWAVAAECEEALHWSRGERRRRGGELLGGIRPELVARCVMALSTGHAPEL
jgi:ADP-heptose:LPS heptosyltransferase